MVHAEFKGTGTKKIMLIAHMDTVYRNGMLKDQPFRVDGDKASVRRVPAARSPAWAPTKTPSSRSKAAALKRA
ncbi:hypothetical protein G6F45_014122 [Rhizopus arrhizus]|nr:hypothetical protein G6F45_014122 [Rhizopus arrhizus]